MKRIGLFILLFVFVAACKQGQYKKENEMILKDADTLADQIIIKLRENNDQIAVEKAFEKYELEFDSRLSKDLKLHLITYNLNKIGPAEMKHKLLDNPLIEQVEFNKRVINREFRTSNPDR